MTAPHEAVPESPNRLPLLAGGGLALVLLVFLATKVLGGGGGGDVQPSTATAATSVTTAAPAAPAAAAPAEEAPVETFEVFNTKNPFQPLRGAAPASSSSPAPAAATPAGPVVATPVAVTAPATATAVAPAPVQTGATGGQATAPVQSTTRVALLDVFTEGGRTVANVRVNDTVSKVAAGDTFASNFKAVSLDLGERCGRFLFGDDQFRLCRGEEVLK